MKDQKGREGLWLVTELRSSCGQKDIQNAISGRYESEMISHQELYSNFSSYSEFPAFFIKYSARINSYTIINGSEF